MEAANEAARRAVNGIISVSGSNATPCKIWDLHEPDILEPWRLWDEYRFNRGMDWSGELPGIFGKIAKWGYDILDDIKDFLFKIFDPAKSKAKSTA
jgi:hypothetical protein